MSPPGLLFEHPSSLEHAPPASGEWHPEGPRRIEAIVDALARSDWLGWERRDAPAATVAELQAVHAPELIERVRGLSAAGGGAIDGDTYVGAGSYQAALHAAGGACALARALLGGEAATGFALLRPPGHHATRERAMGFCLFNNVAVAAQLALRELGAERVLVLDWDVHHGNGTADVFGDRRDVLYASIHRGGFYPGTGALADVGSGEGRGFTLNLPVHAGTSGEVWRSLLEHVALPVAARFGPRLVLISAGFDAHRADPLGGCRLEAEDFAQMACHVRDFGARLGAPVGAVLEGGYDPPALAASALATMRALAGAGDAESIAPEPIYTPVAAAHARRFWDL